MSQTCALWMFPPTSEKSEWLQTKSEPCGDQAHLHCIKCKHMGCGDIPLMTCWIFNWMQDDVSGNPHHEKSANHGKGLPLRGPCFRTSTTWHPASTSWTLFRYTVHVFITYYRSVCMIHDSKHFIKRNLPENGTWCTSSAISIFDRLLSQTPSPHVPRIRRNKAVVGNTLKPQWIEKDSNFLANRWLHLIKAGHMQDTSFLASQDSSSVRSFIMALPTSEAHQIRMMLFHGRWDQGWKGIIRHQPTHLEFHDSPMFHSVHLKMPRRHCTLRQFQDLAFDKSRSTRSWNHRSNDVTE